MIIHLKHNTEPSRIRDIKNALDATVIRDNGSVILVTHSGLKAVPSAFMDLVEEFYVSDSDIQLAGSHYLGGKRTVKINDITIGGSTQNTLIIAGPCSVESYEQMDQVVEFMVSKGIKAIRGGSFKPRTSPYTFQGLEEEGLQILDEMRKKYGITVVTEAKNATHIEKVIEYTDIIQIGTKAMYDQGILDACGAARKPVLLKRAFGATLQEFVQAAEFILSGGNEQVMLCERGIRTFETKTRFTLDLCGVAYLKHHTNLPVVVDPSHAMGWAYGVPDLARAAMAMSIDGLLLEVHPNPPEAKSDAQQQLDFPTFTTLLDALQRIAPAVDRKLI